MEFSVSGDRARRQDGQRRRKWQPDRFGEADGRQQEVAMTRDKGKEIVHGLRAQK
jgi:hypothetical protein